MVSAMRSDHGLTPNGIHGLGFTRLMTQRFHKNGRSERMQVVADKYRAAGAGASLVDGVHQLQEHVALAATVAHQRQRRLIAKRQCADHW